MGGRTMFDMCAMSAFPRRVWLMEMDGHRREESRTVCGCMGNFGGELPWWSPV
jgi:hypothetical protein